jgi:hypothetical protein
MECCVCWESLPTNLHAASFSTDGHCRTDHTLCMKCYSQCDSCPLCRFRPTEKPLSYAEACLNELRLRKHASINMNNQSITNDNEYNHIIDQMLEIKTIINHGFSRVNP